MRRGPGPGRGGGVPVSGREGEERALAGRSGVGRRCRPPRRSVARLRGGRLAGLGRAWGLHRGGAASRGCSGRGVAGDGPRGAADSPRERRARQTRRRGARPPRRRRQRAGAGAGNPGPLRRATAAEGGGRAGGGAPRGACPRGRGEGGRLSRCCAGPGGWTREAVPGRAASASRSKLDTGTPEPSGEPGLIGLLLTSSRRPEEGSPLL